MQLENPQQYVGSYVRIRPHNGNRHFGRAKLIEVEGRFAVVKPFGHGKEERVPVTDLHSWASGNVTRPRQRQPAAGVEAPQL
jgi:hypothetical protein